MEESLKLEKNQLLRNNEYYSIQNIFDKLYSESKNGKTFSDLMQYITSENNILLAYRNIKNNKGSKTAGTDKLDIMYYKDLDKDEFVKRIKDKFRNYNPKSVRRVEIPKPNGGTRPLGIPCMEDRLIQQCIKQVLEPICEAKFHKYSYGFRPNRSTKHAMARCMSLVNTSKMHYTVDIDIKGFFDNVNHAKLKKQLWTIGIRDKNLISIIGKILKSEIKGVGICEKGTPQGGIISPLLANVVLNELDWWISNQWETIKTRYDYNGIRKSNGKEDLSGKYAALRKTNLKEVKFVRYADDIKLFCRDYKTAFKFLKAIKMWLKERLGLDINDEKSKVTNLRKNYSEYLGFRFKVKLKNNKFVGNSRMSQKAKKNVVNKLREQVIKIKKNLKANEVCKLNSMILGMQNYYKIATHITWDTDRIDHLVTRTIRARLKDYLQKRNGLTETYKRLYGNYNGRKYTVLDVTIFPIYGCKMELPRSFNPKICNYTEEGRNLVHTNLRGYNHLMEYLLNSASEYESMELRDNKISLIAGQRGVCYITGIGLDKLDMECHHKVPRSMGGTDEYKNLVWVCSDVHKLIHCKEESTINKYLERLSLDNKQIKKLNSLRKLVGNSVI